MAGESEGEGRGERPAAGGAGEPGGPRPGDGEGSLFERAMEGVEPLGGPSPVPRRKPPSRPPGTVTGKEVSFTVERWGPRGSEQIEGRAPGVSRRTLRRLRRGRYPVEQRLDLHGMAEAEGRRAVWDALALAWDMGRRCLLVVHGRGLHSEGEPVLKSSLPEWLAAPPHGSRVRAFVTAPRQLGGAGATLVLLRRHREAEEGR